MLKRILFFDTETTWTHREKDSIIQFWAIIWTLNLETCEFIEVHTINQFINSDAPINPFAFEVHKIEKSKIQQYGYMCDYIQNFLDHIKSADLIVCHNILYGE